ncbi:hypothetical protein NLU13_2743 [Sarocladium strictum]|uniref:Uncharacterized protein n=1 Tax=Sarocladium strictum TaxID=5046 RepID=A0AA39GKQ1_SARSR|nr:hypothetical protein NLU13_2743 [Sarocladium strictum]
MTDFTDLIGSIDRLRDSIEQRFNVFRNSTTGIEVTQSIQYYRSRSHLTDEADRMRDNAVTLIAHKPAVVRVYVRPPLVSPSGTPVTGRLLVERKPTLFRDWEEVITLSPWLTSTMTPLDDSYADERGNPWNSLNFRVPADKFAGQMRLTFTLDSGQITKTTISAYLVQTLRLRVIPITYSGPSTANPTPGNPATTLNLAAPNLADAQATAALALRMMPVQQTGSFSSTGALTWKLPLDDAVTSDGGCSPNWNALIDELNRIRREDGNRTDVVYYGLLPAGTPLGAVIGCGNDGIGSATVGNQRTFVHEIGHAYGFQHSPSGNVGTPDPNYPKYEPYMSASIGEYGIDIQSGDVFSPATSVDYMSYGPNRWMSLYQHERLINHPRLVPTWTRDRGGLPKVPILYDPKYSWFPEPPRPGGRWPDPRWPILDISQYTVNPVIVVKGMIDDDGNVRVDSVTRLTASPTLAGPELNWKLQLIGEKGGVVARARLTRVVKHGGQGCGCTSGTGHDGKTNELPLEFHAVIPDAQPGSALRILDDTGNEIWGRKAPESPARFASAQGRLSDDGAKLKLAWKMASRAGSDDVSAQYSSDGGETWGALVGRLCDGAAETDTTGLPAGRVLLRLLANDGFTTAVSDSFEIKVPIFAPYPAILYPSEGEDVVAWEVIEVLGSAVDQGGNPVDDELLEWLVDGDAVGSGRAVLLKLSPGDHKLTLRTHTQPSAEVTVACSAIAVNV